MRTYLPREEEKRSLIVESCFFSYSSFLHKDSRVLSCKKIVVIPKLHRKAKEAANNGLFAMKTNCSAASSITCPRNSPTSLLLYKYK